MSVLLRLSNEVEAVAVAALVEAGCAVREGRKGADAALIHTARALPASLSIVPQSPPARPTLEDVLRASVDAALRRKGVAR